MIARTIRLLRRLDDKGNSAIEFALAAPVLALAGLGLADFGFAFHAKLLLESEIGAAQLQILEAKDDPTRVQTYLTEVLRPSMLAAGFTFPAEVEGQSNPGIARVCACPEAANLDLSDAGNRVSCTSTCVVDGQDVAPYLYYVISATADYRMPFPFAGFDEVAYRVERVVQANGG